MKEQVKEQNQKVKSEKKTFAGITSQKVTAP